MLETTLYRHLTASVAQAAWTEATIGMRPRTRGARIDITAWFGIDMHPRRADHRGSTQGEGDASI